MYKGTVEIAGAFLLFVSIYVVMNYYVYVNILNGLAISGISLTAGKMIFWVLGFLFIVGKILSKRIPVPLTNQLGAIWMGVLSIAITVFIFRDISLLVFSFEGNFYILTFILTIMLVIYSIIKGKISPSIKRVHVKNEKISSSPLKIVLLSDIHLGVSTSKKWLSDVVDRVNKLEPDFVVITGDMVDDCYEMVEKFAPIMKGIKTEYGVYAVAGNHEHYQGVNNFYKFCLKANIKALKDENCLLMNKVNLIGIDDKSIKEKKLHSKTKDLLQKSDGIFNILLLHQPVGFKKAAGLGVDLQLSGHTHKGQLPPLSMFISLVYRYNYGLHKIEKSHIYTTSGTGTWGPPMRLLSKNEIVLLEISS